jgi:hypothetical protein
MGGLPIVFTWGKEPPACSSPGLCSVLRARVGGV